MPVRVFWLLACALLAACSDVPAPRRDVAGRPGLEATRRDLERARNEVRAWTRH